MKKNNAKETIKNLVLQISKFKKDDLVLYCGKTHIVLGHSIELKDDLNIECLLSELEFSGAQFYYEKYSTDVVSELDLTKVSSVATCSFEVAEKDENI